MKIVLINLIYLIMYCNYQVYDGMTSTATEFTSDAVKDDHDDDEINEDNSVTDSLTGELLDFMFF